MAIEQSDLNKKRRYFLNIPNKFSEKILNLRCTLRTVV